MYSSGGLTRPVKRSIRRSTLPRHFLRPALLTSHRENDPMAFRLAAIGLRQILRLLLLRCRSSRSKDLELLVLRQELEVLHRQVPRPRFRPEERWVLTVLQRLRPVQERLSSLVTPDTIRRWHRDMAGAKWRCRHRVVSRGRIPDHVRLLVWRLASENPTWGYCRLRGELKKLGAEISATSIRRIVAEKRRPPAKRETWRQFMRTQASSIIACDLFTVESVRLKTLHALFFIDLHTRKVLIGGVTDGAANASWCAQIARNLTEARRPRQTDPLPGSRPGQAVLPRLRRGIPGRRDRDPANAVASTEGQRLCRTLHPDASHRVPRSDTHSGRTASSISVGDLRRALQLRATPSRTRPPCAGGNERPLAAHHRRLGPTSGPLGWSNSRVLPKSCVDRCDRGTHQPRSSHREFRNGDRSRPCRDRFAHRALESSFARSSCRSSTGFRTSILKWHPTGAPTDWSRLSIRRSPQWRSTTTRSRWSFEWTVRSHLAL